MPSPKQTLGIFGERQVTKWCSCPRCKRTKSLRQLRVNFRCADIICDFCGFVAQVKAANHSALTLPMRVPGAAWKPQKERLEAGIYLPLYVVVRVSSRVTAIYYIPADFQDSSLFLPRAKPLSSKAARRGWHGFDYDLSTVAGKAVRIR